MLTIFSTPKPFTGNISTIQENAIRSWTALRPPCEVILFGNEEGTAETAAKLSVKHISEITRNEYGTPLVNAMFEMAQQTAANELLAYVNADIILTDDFPEAARQIKQRPFLMVGQRRDMAVDQPLDFARPGWQPALQEKAKTSGRLHGVTGIDYFVFPRGTYPVMPPLAVGRPGWDNWLIYHTRSRGIPVIDATGMVTAVHQDHGHADFRGGERGFWEGPEAKRNLELSGGVDHMFHLGFADHTLTPEGVRPAGGARSAYFRLRALPVLHPRLRWLLPLVKLPGRIAGALIQNRSK